FWRLRRRTLSLAHVEGDLLRAAVNLRLDPRLAPAFFAQPEAAHQGHGRPARGVGAGDGARPQPGDDRLAVHLRVEVADALVGPVAHPLAVIAHVGRQPGRALPAAFYLEAGRRDG